MELLVLKTKVIKAKIDLADFFLETLKKQKIQLQNGDILAIVSKVVSLTEGRLVSLGSARAEPKVELNQLQKPSREGNSALNSALKRYGKYKPNPALDVLIHKEADKLYPGEMYLAVKDGILTPSAGIDTSNVPENHAILWPKNSYTSAEKIRIKLLEEVNKKQKSHKNKTRLTKLGVVIFDSFILPLRRGVTGIALGYAGFQGAEDERNKKDIYGKKLKVTFRNIADNLAAAATLLTGEANEKTPFVIIRNAPAKFTNKKIRRSEIQMPPEKCLYKSLY